MSNQPDSLDGVIVTLSEELETRSSPRVYAPLAEANRLMGRADEAVRVAREGLEAFPDHIAIRVVLARALADTGARDDALEVYRGVVTRDRDNLEARAALGLTGDATDGPTGPGPGEILAAAGAAATDAPAAFEAQPSGEPATLSEELTHLADLFSPSPAPGDRAPEDELDGIATLTLAEIYARQGLYTRAIDVCERILAKRPNDEQATERLDEYRKALAAIG
jgi:tetratricopeptide (TPR) repeat protein